MRSQLSSCQLTPEWAQAVWPQFAALYEAQCILSLTNTPCTQLSVKTDIIDKMVRNRAIFRLAAPIFAAHEALDCLSLTHEHARETMGPADNGRAIATHLGISEHIAHNRVPLADPAGRRRARRLSHGNAHAYRCAPPRRNSGGGTQGKSH